MFRVGIGQDSHKFVTQDDQKPLILGGIEIPGEKGLEANSDGDAVLHALFNALASAVGKESIGAYADSMCQSQNIKDSQEYLKVAHKMVDEAGYKVNNVAISVEAMKPRFSKELVQKMQAIISELCSIPENSVGITATSGESLTAFGKGEGIQVFAIVSLVSKNE